MNDYVQKKRHEIQRQLGAILCDQYRITLKPRLDGLRPENYGNVAEKVRKKSGTQERFWSASELISEMIIRDLTKKNMAGYDIYITPISLSHHHLVIDDVTQAKLEALLAGGYKPSLILASSEDNCQIILIVSKIGGPDEQSIANRLVRKINQEYGDIKFTGVVHPFRLAGFFNKKQGRGDAIATVLHAQQCICDRASRELDLIRSSVADLGLPALTPRGGAGGVLSLKFDDADTQSIETFKRHWQQTYKMITERGLPIDLSRIDFRVAKNMLSAGFRSEQIAAAMFDCSPELQLRKSNPAKYVTDTVINASK